MAATKKVSQVIARLEETAQIKLYDKFKRCGIISPPPITTQKDEK